MELADRVRNTVIQYAMISRGDRVLTGLSGGPDSICLAVILDKLKDDFNISLAAVYIDHGLRPREAEKEADFCRKFCEDRGIEFFLRRADVRKFAAEERLNMQEAARELRYRIYEELAAKLNFTRIALGHNADDQAETVLMRLFRGSGRKGLSGIPPVRGRIIRPLIDVERREIETFLSSGRPVTYAVDSSNLKDDYFRNWIRRNVMDRIKCRAPAVVREICRTAKILQEEDEYLEIIVTKTLMRLISRKSDDSIELFLYPLASMEKPVLRRVIRRAVNETRGLRGIAFVHIEDIIRLIKQGRPGDRLHLPGDIRAIKEYSLIKITTRKPVRISEYELHPPCELALKEAGITIKASFEEKVTATGDGRRSVLLDAGPMKFPLRVRARVSGDFFYPAGFGRRKKLQDFFVDEKIPRDRRDIIPVVLSGNDIIWVAGYRADERFRPHSGTGKFLRLEISGEEYSSGR